MLGGGSNKGVMSVVYGAIVFAITIVFIVQFRPNSGQKSGKITQECVANVRNRCITPKEFLAEMGLMAPRGMDEKKLAAMAIHRQVMNGLVERALLNQDAARLGVTVSDGEINQQVGRGRFHVSLPVAQQRLARWLGLAGSVRMIPVTSRKTKKFSYKSYKRMVRLYTNRSPVEFKVMQRRELIAERMRQLIRSRASVTEAEAFASYQRTRSSAKLDYVRLRRSFFLKRYVDLSDKAVEAWAKDHAKQVDEMWKKRKATYPAGCRRARHVLVQIKSATAPAGHAREEAQKIIDKARKRLAQGESFASVAAELSEDKSSAPKGGDLGCFGEKSNFPKSFKDAVFSQEKTGFLDKVIETPFGFHLVDVTLITSKDAKKAEQQARLDVAKDMKASMEVDELIKQTAEKIRKAAGKDKKLQAAIDETLVALDEEHGIGQDGKDKNEEATPEKPAGYPTVETTGTFTRVDETPMDDVSPGQDVVGMAFDLKKAGDVAKDLIKTKNGYAMIALREAHLATRREFKQDRDKYIQSMRALKAQDLLVNYVQRLREEAKGMIKISERWAQEPKTSDKN